MAHRIASVGLVVLISLLLCIGSVFAQAPVASYGMDAGSGTTLTDASGNGHTGTISNATWATGKYGNGLSFNGTTASVSIAHTSLLNLSTGVTLMAWVNPTTVSAAWRDVLNKSTDRYFLSGTSDQSGKPAGGVVIGTTYYQVFGTTALATNTWSHLAMTYDGSNVRLYVNGSQVASTAATGNIATSTTHLTIGSVNGTSQYFSGLIDEVRVYNYARTAAQIVTDKDTPIGGGDTTPPTVSITAPANNATVSGQTAITADASDNVGVVGVQFKLNGNNLGAEDTTSPYSVIWDTTTASNGAHTLTAVARDAAGNQTTSAATNVTVNNTVQIVLHWDKACGEGLIGYKIYTATSQAGTYTLLTTIGNPNVLNYAANVPTGQVTYLKVCSYDASTEVCSKQGAWYDGN